MDETERKIRQKSIEIEILCGESFYKNNNGDEIRISYKNNKKFYYINGELITEDSENNKL